jgi:phenylacetic acid degradation operon negative regulatory protein
MKARSMLVTLYGDSILRYGGEVAARSLLALMEVLGFSPPSVRAALGRMVRQRWLLRWRVGRRSFYALTPRGRLRVEHGTRRIYALDHGPWDGQWRLLTYTFPESGRAGRDRLRRELAWLGMGPLVNGTWISPYDLHEHLAAFIDTHGLRAHVAEFVGEHVGPASDHALVARCWDLSAIERWHETFLAEFRPRLTALQERLATGRPPGEREAFAEKIRLVHEYRKALHVDPWLPDMLLPPQWRGRESANLFSDYHRLLDPPATRFFESLFEGPPGTQAAVSAPFRPVVA